MEKETQTNEMVIIPMNAIQLAKIYGVGIKTFRKWMEPHKAEIGDKIGRFYTISQVKIILEKFGIPGTNLKM